VISLMNAQTLSYRTVRVSLPMDERRDLHSIVSSLQTHRTQAYVPPPAAGQPHCDPFLSKLIKLMNLCNASYGH
jgi:hypothetical protein